MDPASLRILSSDQKLFNDLFSTAFPTAKKRRMSRAIANNTNSFNVWNNVTVTTADDESQIRAWLSPLEPQARHQDICNQRVDGIGDWLLETEEFMG